MNQAVEGEPSQDAWEDAVRQTFMDSYAGTLATQVADRYAPKITNAFWLAQRNGTAARWYVQYCIKF